MLDHIDITRVLFFDIETVPAEEKFELLNLDWQGLWAYKCKSLLKKDEANISSEELEIAYERAGIYSEFGKIICISVGYLHPDKETKTFEVRIKSFHGHDEKTLLKEFSAIINQFFNKKENPFLSLCGHNIREFDVPYVCRRMVIYQLELPTLFDVAGKKPWEVKFIVDTLEIWKFGDNKAYTSLKLLCALFGIKSPKGDISGADVAKVYYEEKSTDRIARYCERDVFAVMELLVKFKLYDSKLEFPT